MDIRPDAGPFRLAVDLGTTSIHWRLLDGTGHEAASGQALNPQMGAGSDVVSRLAAARNQEGRERLGHLVIRFLQRVVSDVGVPVAELCIAGNTAMTSILLNEDVAGLCAAPYRLTEPGGRTAELPGLPPAWIPPQPAPFVGGDISAGMAALLYGEPPEFPFLLADMGTNGEFVLALDKERSFIASVPLGRRSKASGSATAGWRIRAASRDSGSVRSACLPWSSATRNRNGFAARAICRCWMRCCGQVSSTPRVALRRLLFHLWPPACSGPSNAGPLAGACRCPAAWSLPGPTWRKSSRSRPRFRWLWKACWRSPGWRAGRSRGFASAGALGEHMPETALERLGFLPQGLQARTVAEGNTSLRGAALLLTRPELRERLVRWSSGCTLVDLAARPDFTALYMRHMVFG